MFKSNVMVCSVLPRHDNPYLSYKVKLANSILSNEAHSRKFFFECNHFTPRSHFTQHGLHFNITGKRYFAVKCAWFIDTYTCNAPSTNLPHVENRMSNELHSEPSSTHDVFSSFIIHRKPGVPVSSDELVNSSPLMFTPHNRSIVCAGAQYSTNVDQFHSIMDDSPGTSSCMIPTVMGNRPIRVEANFPEMFSTSITISGRHTPAQNLSFNFYYQNVRGVRTKLVNLRCQVPLVHYDVIVLIETWLTESINDAELGFDDFIVYRCDRDSITNTATRGGGVLVAVRKSFSSHKIFIVDNNSVCSC